MIAVDTSALVAILRGEVEAEAFLETMVGDACCLSAVGYFETSMVMIGRGAPELAQGLDELVERRGIEIVAFDAELASASKAAFIRFGQGRHAAGLNFGDCASYALARLRGVPLLFKGADFARTDIVPAYRAQ